jgi:L-lactate dehydrogenase complex protein LldG
MSREEVLARIRRSLDATRVADITRRAAAAERLEEPGGHPVPARARQPQAALQLLFESELRRAGASIVWVDGADKVPAAIAAYLAECKLPMSLRMGQDAALARLPWSKIAGLAVERGAAAASDTAAVSHAAAGVAETGTLVLASGPANPASLAFVPDTHVIVLSAEAIVGSYEEAIQRLRQHFPGSSMPRSLNLVSGPSRTGDIGGRIVVGAQGPRRLAVVVVKVKREG